MSKNDGGAVKPDRDELMARVDAARVYTRTVNNPSRQEELELAAFMALFHPGHSLTRDAQ